MLTIDTLRTDYTDRPLGIDGDAPTLSWQLHSDRRGVVQTAYRVIAASTEDQVRARDGDLWDSGRVESADSIGVRYAGTPPSSGQRVWWRVEVWDDRGESALGEPTWWEAGLRSPADWVGDWLEATDPEAEEDAGHPVAVVVGAPREAGRTQRFRLRFGLPSAAVGGTLALGSVHGACRLDGRPISDYSLRGPVPDLALEKIALSGIPAGDHVLELDILPPELVLAHATPSPQKVAVHLRFVLADGTVARVATTGEWQTAPGAASASPASEADWVPAEVETVPGRAHIPDTTMLLRREFTLSGQVVRARLRATALGAYEPRLNGARVGDALLTPEISLYESRILSRTWDVTDDLRDGANVLGFVVGDGWYASHPDFQGRYRWSDPPRRLLAQLEVAYADGSVDVIAGDDAWRIAPSAIVQGILCNGELHDARVDQPGWDAPGFDAGHWAPARVGATPPGRVTAQASPPIRVVDELEPVTVASPRPDVHIVDFGQNFAGWCRVTARGESGHRIHVRYGEQLTADGALDQRVMFGGPAADSFILRGDGVEVFEPRFTYHGFRYVEVTGLGAAPTAENLVGVVIGSDLPRTIRLDLPDPLLERIWNMTLWTEISNLTGIPTDCPNRAERMGWMGDAGVTWDAVTFQFDAATFTRRQMDNVRDQVGPAGFFPIHAPFPGDPTVGDPKGDGAEPVWSDASVILPWTAWRRYGDRGGLEAMWPAIVSHLAYVERHNPDHVWRHKNGFGFGDWLNPELLPGQAAYDDPDFPQPTPKDLLGTAYWAYSLGLAAEIADALGHAAEAGRLRGVRERVARAFVDAFVAGDGRIGRGSQTSYLVALAFGLLPEDRRAAAVAHLVADIRGHGTALTTGLAGTRWILDVLADTGHTDLAHDLLLRTEEPSWGYMIAKGATTVWERWDGDLDWTDASGSHNHPALGSVAGYLVRRIAAIDDGEAGFAEVVVRPDPGPRIRRGGGEYASIRGTIRTAWAADEDGSFLLDVTIPANATGRIHLPVAADAVLTEGGAALGEDVEVVVRTAVETVLRVGSGSYVFRAS